MRAILALLFETYEARPRPDGDDVLALLVRTILSQATTNVNSDRAFATLLATFEADWGRVARADEAAVRAAIESGGLARQKAPRIQAILRRVHEIYHEYSLESLRGQDIQDILQTLNAFPGVGPKTAAFVAMWALSADVFPMDTHIFRILKRVGLLRSRVSDAMAHAQMQDLIAEGQRFDAHMALVDHGRAICAARNPLCSRCVIAMYCDYAKENTYVE